jgi:YD repeat-containing protein
MLRRYLFTFSFGFPLLTAYAGTTTYNYDPRGDLVGAAYSGGPSMAYVYDPLGNRLSETVTLAPTAQNSTASVAYNASNVSLPLTFSNATALQITTSAGHGAAAVSGLSILYTPNTGFSGNDSLAYVAQSGGSSSSPATVAISVAAAPPVAGNVNATVAFNSGLTNIPLALSGGAAAVIAVASAPAHGSTQVSGIQIAYQPATGYTGADSFTYSAANASGTSA